MTTEHISDDPFADLADDDEMTPKEQRTQLLAKVKRGYTPIRKILVQRSDADETRAAKLAELVHGKHHRPLDALLLLHGLEPILRDEPLDIRTWARLLSVSSMCSPNAASKAIGTLVHLGLVSRSYEGRQARIRPLHEGGAGDGWTRPGESKDADGFGYLTLPHAYWNDDYSERLSLPGKAMLLIMLKETHPRKQTFVMPVDRAFRYYGISERSAERGYRDLSKANLLLDRVIKKSDPAHPASRREEHHRALAFPFNVAERERLQVEARDAVRGKADRSS